MTGRGPEFSLSLIPNVDEQGNYLLALCLYTFPSGAAGRGVFLIVFFFKRGPNWRHRRCSCVLHPLDQERRALVLVCHE